MIILFPGGGEQRNLLSRIVEQFTESRRKLTVLDAAQRHLQVSRVLSWNKDNTCPSMYMVYHGAHSLCIMVYIPVS